MFDFYGKPYYNVFNPTENQRLLKFIRLFYQATGVSCHGYMWKGVFMGILITSIVCNVVVLGASIFSLCFWFKYKDD